MTSALVGQTRDKSANVTALVEADTGIAAPLVPVDEDPGRLAFPIRLGGNSRQGHAHG